VEVGTPGWEEERLRNPGFTATLLALAVAFPLCKAAAAPPLFDPVGGERALNANIYATEGQWTQFVVSARDPDGDSLTYAASNVPPWAAFDPTTRVFSGTPPLWSTNFTTRKNQTGIFNVRFTASDGAYTVDKIVAINVKDTNWTLQSMPDLLAARAATGGTPKTPVAYSNVDDSVIWVGWGGGTNIRRVTIAFTSQVPTLAGFEKDWSTLTNYVYLPIGDAAVSNAGVVIEGGYAGNFGRSNFAERICAEMRIPAIFMDVDWEGRFPNPPYYFDAAVSNRDPRYIWWPFVSAHFMRSADALITVMRDLTSWTPSYSNFQYIVTGHSKFGAGSWTTAASDPERVAGLMSAGFEPQDYDACRLLGSVQGPNNLVPDAWSNYVGTMMKYYTEPLGHLDQMNPSTKALLSGGTQDLRGSNAASGGYHPKYLTFASRGQLPALHRLGHIPNLPHTTQSPQHSRLWKMWVAHCFLGRPVSEVSAVRRLPGTTNIPIEVVVSGGTVVTQVNVWATSQSDLDTNDWNGFVSYPATLTGGVYRAAIPTNSTAYYAVVQDISTGVEGMVSSAPFPVNRDYPVLFLPPGSVTGLQAVPDPTNGAIRLAWTNPADADFVGVVVSFKTNGYPADAADGSKVYDGSGSTCDHTGVAAGATYYYAAFSYDAVGDYSTGSLASAVAPARDSDGDGMPDSWEIAGALSPTNATGDDGPNGDPDGDGVNNWLEYLGDTRPKDSNSLLRVTAINLVESGVWISWQGGTGVVQFLERNSELSEPSSPWTVVLTNTPPMPPATNVFTVPPAGDRQFYRLKAVR
jgi:hypothetical protein